MTQNRSVRVRWLAMGLAMGLFASAAWADSPPLEIGMSEAEITPPEGFPISGYYYERKATGTHDPLKAKAIVFRQGERRAALVVCDLTGVSADLSGEVRRRAAEQTGIPVAHIAVAATHSHTAPDYYRDLFAYLGERAEDGRQRYAARLIERIVRAIVGANSSAQAVAVQAGTTRQQTSIAFNRRFLLRDGSVRTWMRLDNPDVVRAAGPTDPEVGLVLVRTLEGDRPLGVVSNFALHLDTRGGTLWSADYPFYVEQAVRQALGPQVVSLFGNGCCGDINHADPVASSRNKTDFIGQSLGATVVDGLTKLAPIEQPALCVRTADVQLPLQKTTAEEIAAAGPLLRDAAAGKKVDFFDQVKAYKALVLDQLHNRPPLGDGAELLGLGLTRAWGGIGDHLPGEVQVIAVNRELAIVCLPAEIFVDLGLAIKQASPFRTTLIVELCNCDEPIYIPTRVACAGGSYEVTNSLVQPGTGELLAATAVRLLREAASDTSPPAP